MNSILSISLLHRPALDVCCFEEGRFKGVCVLSDVGAKRGQQPKEQKLSENQNGISIRNSELEVIVKYS